MSEWQPVRIASIEHAEKEHEKMGMHFHYWNRDDAVKNAGRVVRVKPAGNTAICGSMGYEVHPEDGDSLNVLHAPPGPYTFCEHQIQAD